MDSPLNKFVRYEQWTRSALPVIGTRQVLVVNEYEDVVASMVAVLEIKGFDAKSALNSKQALCLFENWRPQMVYLGHLPAKHPWRRNRQAHASHAERRCRFGGLHGIRRFRNPLGSH